MLFQNNVAKLIMKGKKAKHLPGAHARGLRGLEPLL